MQFTVSIRHHFDSEVPCIHVTIDYFEILSLFCHQGNNIFIPTPVVGLGGNLLYELYIAMWGPKGYGYSPGGTPLYGLYRYVRP